MNNTDKLEEFLDDAYKNYVKSTPEQYVVGSDSDIMRKCMVWKRKTDSLSGYPILERLSKEEFINKIKTDSEFSERWGLKIEERELSLEERNYSLGSGKAYKGIFGIDKKDDLEYKELFDKENRPTRAITITYTRELSLDERYKLANINNNKEKLPGEPNYTEEQQHSMLDELVPTRAINQKIEVYE